MLIDWFTVAAQALNFLILVWLLKRVLYKPILAAIVARETLVAAELAGAAEKMNVADNAMAEFKSKNDELERNRAAVITHATEEARVQSARLLETARAAADALQIKRRDALQRESKDLSEGLRHQAQQAFFTLAKQAFKDLADSRLETQMATIFCQRLRGMTTEEKKKLSSAIRSCTQPALIRSAFLLPNDLQNMLQAEISETFERAIVLRFEVAPDLVSGIELTADGQRVGWSISEYLTTLERGIDAALAVTAAASNHGQVANNAKAPVPKALLALT